NEAKKEIREIDVNELKRMQQSGDDFVLIDVREPDEVAKGAIPGAVPIPRGVLELKIDQVTTDKDKKVVLYCGGGNRSAARGLDAEEDGLPQPHFCDRWLQRLEKFVVATEANIGAGDGF